MYIIYVNHDSVIKQICQLRDKAFLINETGYCKQSSLHVVVPLLTYLLMKEDNTPEEVNAIAIDVVFAGVDTVSIN